mgnify:CR=1 FL=1
MQGTALVWPSRCQHPQLIWQGVVCVRQRYCNLHAGAGEAHNCASTDHDVCKVLWAVTSWVDGAHCDVGYWVAVEPGLCPHCTSPNPADHFVARLVTSLVG